MCNSGFHCSRKVYQASSYVQGGVLAEVEVKGDSIIWKKLCKLYRE